jgi:Leucine-rich repeat (LRR) protein
LGSSQIFGELFTFFPSQTTTHPFLQNIRVNLRELDLTDIDLDFLSPAIGNLHRLKNLSLSGNHLKTLPKEIGNLKMLSHLYLSRNPITSLPSDMDNLINLQMFLHDDGLEISEKLKEILEKNKDRD